MGYVFISYSSKDRDFVTRLATDLVKAGHDLWLDYQKITGRKPYWQEIQDGIEGCSHFLIVVSPDSMDDSSGAITELYHVSGLKPLPVIVPVLFREVPLKKLPIIISPGRYQIHDFVHQPYETMLASVLKALESALTAQRVNSPEVQDASWKPPTLKEMLATNRARLEEPGQSSYNAPTRPVISSLAQLSALASQNKPESPTVRKRRVSRTTVYIVAAIVLMSLIGGLLASSLSPGTALQRTPTPKQTVAAQIARNDVSLATSPATDLPENAATMDSTQQDMATMVATSISTLSTGSIGTPDLSAALPSWDSTPTRTFTGHSAAVLSVDFSPDGKYVLSGSEDKTAQIWDLTADSSQDNTGMTTFTGQGSPADSITSAVFSPDGKKVLTGSGDHSVRLWQVGKTLTELHRFSGNVYAVTSVAFSPDGTQVLAGGWDKIVRLWNITQTDNAQVFKGHTDTVYSVAFSPDGQEILTGSFDKTARLWSIQTGKELQEFSQAGAILITAFSPDGQQILTGGKDNTAELWDVKTGSSLRLFQGHTDSVTDAVFSPDGLSILTASDDGTARLWDAATGKELHRFTGHEGKVTSVAFSPNGKCIVTGSADKTVRLWQSGSCY